MIKYKLFSIINPLLITNPIENIITVNGLDTDVKYFSSPFEGVVFADYLFVLNGATIVYNIDKSYGVYKLDNFIYLVDNTTEQAGETDAISLGRSSF